MCLLALCIALPGHAQGDDQDQGVTMTIQPAATFYGGAVTVSGATAIDPRTQNRTMDYVQQREFLAKLKWEIKGKEDGI